MRPQPRFADSELNARECAQKGHFDTLQPPRFRARASAAFGQPEAGSRRALQPGTSRGARLEPCARAAGDTEADQGHPLSSRLADNGAALLNAHRVNTKAIDEGRAITPTAEWLVDNYHLVEKTDPRDPIRSATWILPTTTQARRRTVCGVSACLRHGLAGCVCRPARAQVTRSGPQNHPGWL